MGKSYKLTIDKAEIQMADKYKQYWKKGRLKHVEWR